MVSAGFHAGWLVSLVPQDELHEVEVFCDRLEHFTDRDQGAASHEHSSKTDTQHAPIWESVVVDEVFGQESSPAEEGKDGDDSKHEQCHPCEHHEHPPGTNEKAPGEFDQKGPHGPAPC